MPFFLLASSLGHSKHWAPLLFQGVPLAEYGFYGCLVVNPKRVLEFTIAVMAVLHDRNSNNITQENRLRIRLPNIVFTSWKFYETSRKE